MQAKATTVCVQKQKHPTLLILHFKCAPFSCSCYPLQSTCRRISPTKSIWFMIYLGSEQWFSGCSIPRIKDQEGKRTVTYLAVVVVHWVMWSTSCALDAREIRLLFLLPTSITGRSASWMSSGPFLPFLIQVQEIIESRMKYCIDAQARCEASKAFIWTYFHWAFHSLRSQHVQDCTKKRSHWVLNEKLVFVSYLGRPPKLSQSQGERLS